MLRLLKQVKFKDYILFFVAAIFIVAQVYTELKIPELFASLINQIVERAKLGQVNDYSFILPVALEMLAYILATLAAFFAISFFMSRFSANVSKNFRQIFFDKVLELSNAQAKNFSTSSLLTRTTNDIANMERFFSMGLRVFITAPIMATMSIFKIMQGNFSLALGTAIAVLILALTVIVIFLFAMPKVRKVQILTDKINSSAKESLTGIKDIRAFNKEEFHSNRFEEVNSEMTKTGIFIDRIMSFLDPMMIFVMTGLVLFIYWFGAYLASIQILNIGDIMAFSQYATMVLMSLTMLTFVLVMMPRASVSAKRINEVLKIKEEIKFIEEDAFDEVSKKEPFVEFKKVSFSYPGAKDSVLKDISFKIEKGKTIAFIGATGSGKSTLINLLTRLYDATDGEILIEGQNINNFSKQTLLDKISFVPQKALLFKGTVRSNLELKHKNKSEEQLVKALEIAQAKKFVFRDELGLEKEVSQGGSNFSGGQKQRLAIARALVSGAEIMIFDDSFSALDYKTDKNLRKALNKNFENSTKFIVAQRVGTIIDADKIIVLENGKIVGNGTHEQLLKSSSVYRQIAESQLQEEVDK